MGRFSRKRRDAAGDGREDGKSLELIDAAVYLVAEQGNVLRRGTAASTDDAMAQGIKKDA